MSSPAKINIALSVGPLRPDGFHELITVFHAVGLLDTVTASASDALELALTGPESAGLPADSSNLAWRAAEALAARFDVAPRVALSVRKRIPVAAGLAGGSADAAAALVACARLWRLPVGADQLAELAAALGSDVPFALTGRTAIGTGRGERLRPTVPAAGLHWVLAAADRSLSTPAVYRELDRLREIGEAPAAVLPAGARRAEAAAQAATTGDLTALAAAMGNDLQAAALSLAPELAATLRAGEQLGALRAIVSGSGPTCAFLATDQQAARRIATELGRSGTCRWAIAVSGSEPGALASGLATADQGES